MAIAKGRSDGGQGGKRGHSNMDHWDFTEDIKLAAKKSRRLEAKNDVKKGVGEYHEDATTQSSEESEK
ncbi:MAG: hypothetical protein QOE96_1254 [Blastocatellia bacterium]|jgi:hypothetical protein|nr:hypothetical protein [Blastocatellia bacterium]